MAKRVIVLRGDPIVNEEEPATEAITPGHFIELTSTGWRKNTANAANIAPIVALEREEFGKEIGDAYATNDYVKAAALAPGMRVYAFIPSGQNIAKGAYLTGDAAGRLSSSGVAAGIRTAQALEAVNNSAGPGDARIRVQIV
jgi:hypothetical protein